MTGPGSDLEIARSVQLAPIESIAELLGIPATSVERRGPAVAKVTLDAIPAMGPPRARYILVTATSPTPLGEGKTTTSIGLAQAFKHLGKLAVVSLRQPSLGPTFGIKGGAAGGGYSQVVPVEDIDLHLTGDFHAVSVATNLLAALVDNHLYHGNVLDLADISWRRVVDVNDRALREVVIGLGRRQDGVPRRTGFDITAASETMAILGLSADLADLRARLERTVVGLSSRGAPVTAGDLHGAGAMAVLLTDALDPNLMQTLEGTPALVHTGPFANIAHGNSSIVADQIGIRGADYLITEAGFGADIGAEKFFNIKCRTSGLRPDAAVIVTTVRALKVHSGHHSVRPGRPLPPALFEEHPDEVLEGAANLRRHIAIVRHHGVVPVVAVNAFPGDHPSEHDAIAKVCADEGVHHAVARPHSDGGAGCLDLAREVEAASASGSDFRLLYPDGASLREKIETIATRIYGADGVDYDPDARRLLDRYEELGWGRLPICMAKTHLSLTHDPRRTGAPTGWTFPVRGVRAAIGAGFVLPLAGDIRTMPGLGADPAAFHIDIDDGGNVVGLA